MKTTYKHTNRPAYKNGALALIAPIAMLAIPAGSTLSAQELPAAPDAPSVTVTGEAPTEGPKIEGVIVARSGNMLRIAGEDGSVVELGIDEQTDIRAKGGFLGLGRETLTADALLNGLPVTVETLDFGTSLIASDVRFNDEDLEMASMIRNGTSQRFAAHRTDIDTNSAAAEALRGRMGDIDKYNIKGTTNVFFDTNEWQLSGSARQELCAAANQAKATDNALLLVVGYTDSTGSQDYNQTLSERRAGRVVNFLPQECGWEPWRMLTPTGFAEADPLADNSTAAGMAQNRRVAVNILVSKAVEGG